MENKKKKVDSSDRPVLDQAISRSHLPARRAESRQTTVLGETVLSRYTAQIKKFQGLTEAQCTRTVTTYDSGASVSNVSRNHRCYSSEGGSQPSPGHFSPAARCLPAGLCTYLSCSGLMTHRTPGSGWHHFPLKPRSEHDPSISRCHQPAPAADCIRGQTSTPAAHFISPGRTGTL